VTPIAVITNRGSTRNLRGDNWVDPMLAGEANVTHIQVDRADQVEGAVRHCAAVGAEAIVVNGGDGTADLVFGALLNGNAYPKLPALALLPAGKTNMTTAGWSLTGTPERALAALLKSRREGSLLLHIVSRPVLTLRRDATSPPLYGAFFGAAEVVDGIRFCRRYIYPLRMPNALSHAAAIAILFWRGLRAGGNRGAVAVENNGTPFESGNYFAVVVTALDELLLGLKPTAPYASGALHYLSLKIGAPSILRAIPDMIRRRVTPGPGRTVHRTEHLTLNFTGAYTLDGELYEAREDQPLVLDGKQHLNFIRLPVS
jgi:diacylglycerol kinase family enzyme